MRWTWQPNFKVHVTYEAGTKPVRIQNMQANQLIGLGFTCKYGKRGSKITIVKNTPMVKHLNHLYIPLEIKMTFSQIIALGSWQ